MQRRTLLKLGWAGAATLGLAAALPWGRPAGLDGVRVGPGGWAVFSPVARALLDTVLQPDPASPLALPALRGRLDAVIAGLPEATRSELDTLLAVLASPPGRRWLAGLDTPWEEASVPAIQQTLDGMRVSGLALRQQAYHALHDLVIGAFFADQAAWPLMGYPGPLRV